MHLECAHFPKLAPLGPLRCPHYVRPTVLGVSDNRAISISESDVVFFEDFAGQRRGRQHDTEPDSEFERHNWAVGLGQARRVGVKFRIEGEEVPDQG